MSSDLNPMEDILSKQIYKGGRQFDILSQFQKAIQGDWAIIDLSVLKSLVNSLPRCLIQSQ